jgi:prepilin-type N-terminal cleavage/methylation domain-containing protein
MKSATCRQANDQKGFTIVEVIMGMTIGAFVLAGIYRLWSNNSQESLKIQRKIEVRNQLALSTKKLNQSIILAGLGLNKVVGLTKVDAVGSDTLKVYINNAEERTSISMAYDHHYRMVRVTDGSLFENAQFLVLANGTSGEVRPIATRNGHTIYVSEAFDRDFPVAGTLAMPATRQKYYTDQERDMLVCTVNFSEPTIVGRSIKNFQIAFRDRNGSQTSALNEIRFVNYSLTGVYPAKEGAISSVVFSSTSIPRNIL